MIPDTELRDVGTDCEHDPCDLVTQHRRRRNEIVSGKQQIGVTQPGRPHLDENFAPDRRGNVHILEVEPVAECVNYKRLHWWPPYGSWLADDQAGGLVSDGEFRDCFARPKQGVMTIAIVLSFPAAHARRMTLSRKRHNPALVSRTNT